MKCGLCGKQTARTIENDGVKTYLCEECVLPNEQEKLAELKCSFMVGLLDNGEIIFDVDGPDVNAINLAGLLAAAKLIINSNLQEALQGDDENA